MKYTYLIIFYKWITLRDCISISSCKSIFWNAKIFDIKKNLSRQSSLKKFNRPIQCGHTKQTTALESGLRRDAKWEG